jgi:cation transport ATPase
VVVIADTIKTDARQTVSEMKALGLVPLLVTGDNGRTANAVAAEVGIETVYGSVPPQGKAELVRQLQDQGARVMMVGDGISDAPALMQSDVGAAIGAGTDIAIESSDIILIGQRLGAVLDARQIGAASYRKTVQNLWLAFLFNGIGVPLATTGWVHPAWAMIAMALSVSAVLANSFGGRLLSQQPNKETPTPQPTVPARFKEISISVPGIHCQACVETIEACLLLDAGVVSVNGNAKQKAVEITFDFDVISHDQLRTQIKEIGFKVG